MSHPLLAGTGIAPDVTATIGNTPLVALPQLMAAEQLDCLVTLKMEQLNPGGSAKDRPALQMILEAERAGLLRPGGTIVEPTSGNTGVGLSLVAAQRGYRVVCVCTSKVSFEKIALLQAYGAQVVICPVAVAPEDERSYYRTAERLTRELGAFRPDQYSNPANPKAHELTTGPEIWEQTAGRITHFVAGAGTSGTITGVARYLKAQNPAIRVIAADPQGSLFSGGDGRPYLVEGVGEDFYPAAWQPDLYDDIVPVSDADSFATARRISRLEGILIGGSGGTAIAAAIRVARTLGPEHLMVVLNPDSGRGYLSRVFNDDWMASHGFSTGNDTDDNVAALLDGRGNAPQLWYASPSDTVRETIGRMNEHGISQMPVCENTPPFALAEVCGAVDELSLLSATRRDSALLDAKISDVAAEALAQIGVHEPIERLSLLLHTQPAVLVVADGRPLTVLTRSDLLRHLTRHNGR